MQKLPWKFVTFKFPGRIASLLRGSFFFFSKSKKKRISTGRGTGNGRSGGEDERFQLCTAKRIVGKRKHSGNTLEKQMYISLDQRNQFGWTSSSLIYHDLFFSACSFFGKHPKRVFLRAILWKSNTIALLLYLLTRATRLENSCVFYWLLAWEFQYFLMSEKYFSAPVLK